MNKQYKLGIAEDSAIYCITDNCWINKNSESSLYQEYLKWLEEGNTPLPADPIPEPEPLTAQQKLEAAGLTIEELKELLGL